MTNDILDDLFHGCALQAWLEQAALEGRMPCEFATRVPALRGSPENEAADRTIDIGRK